MGDNTLQHYTWFDAVKNGYLRELQRFIEQGEKVGQLNERGKLNLETNKIVNVTDCFKGQNALHIAAQYGLLEVVHFLIINGLDPNLRDVKGMIYPIINFANDYLDGFNTLHWAVANNHIEIVRYLLAYGEDPLEKTSRGVNALHLASGLGNIVNSNTHCWQLATKYFRIT